MPNENRRILNEIMPLIGLQAKRFNKSKGKPVLVSKSEISLTASTTLKTSPNLLPVDILAVVRQCLPILIFLSFGPKEYIESLKVDQKK